MSYLAKHPHLRNPARLLAWLAAVMFLVAANAAIAQDRSRGENKSPDRPGRRADRAGPRREHGSRRGPRRRSERLSDAQIKELLDSLKEYRPDFHKRLIQLRTDDPRAYRSALGGAWRWYRRLGWKDMPLEVKRAAIAEQKARVQIWRLVRKTREASSAQEKLSLAGELRQAVVERFEARQVLMTYRLERLEKEIQRLRAELKERADQQEQIVAERIERLMKATTQPARPWRGRRRRQATTQPAE